MSYTITNVGASIRFSNTDGFFFLLKQNIRSIQSVRDDLIKIEMTGDATGLFVYASQVAAPVIQNAEELAMTLIEWITSSLTPRTQPSADTLSPYHYLQCGKFRCYEKCNNIPGSV